MKLLELRQCYCLNNLCLHQNSQLKEIKTAFRWVIFNALVLNNLKFNNNTSIAKYLKGNISTVRYIPLNGLKVMGFYYFLTRFVFLYTAFLICEAKNCNLRGMHFNYKLFFTIIFCSHEGMDVKKIPAQTRGPVILSELIVLADAVCFSQQFLVLGA